MNRVPPIREEVWHEAQQRVLAYLQCLRLPSPENLELALEALKQARAGLDHSPEAHPVTESWRALHRLLAEKPLPEAQDRGLPELKILSPVGIQGLCGAIQPMPALNRGSMVPGKLR